MLGVALALGAGWLAKDFLGNWDLLAFAPAALVLATLPFFAFNAGNLAGSTPSVIWRLRWPGWPSVLSAATFVLVTEAADKGIELFGDIVAPGRSWVTLALGFLLWVIALLWALVWQVAWLDRAAASAVAAMRRRALAPAVVSAVVLQELRYWFLGGLFAVPILAVAVATIFFIPQMEYSMQARGAELPAAWRALAAAARFVTAWWWLAVMPLAWFLVVARARLLVQLGTAEPIAVTPATRPDSGPATTSPPTA
jgi:hypothetical protein